MVFSVRVIICTVFCIVSVISEAVGFKYYSGSPLEEMRKFTNGFTFGKDFDGHPVVDDIKPSLLSDGQRPAEGKKHTVFRKVHGADSELRKEEIQFERIRTIDPTNATKTEDSPKLSFQNSNTTKHYKYEHDRKVQKDHEREETERFVKPAQGTSRYMESGIGDYGIPQLWRTKYVAPSSGNTQSPSDDNDNRAWVEDEKGTWRRRYPTSSAQQVLLDSQQQEMILFEVLGEKSKLNKTIDDPRGFQNNLIDMLGKSE